MPHLMAKTFPTKTNKGALHPVGTNQSGDTLAVFHARYRIVGGGVQHKQRLRGKISEGLDVVVLVVW